MLLSTMNYREVNRAFMHDREQLESTTLQRLLEEYHKERKKLRISKDQSYCKTYPIKTKTKNNWLIFIQKSPSVTYRGKEDIAYCCVTYYHDGQGLVVMRYSDYLKEMEVFWGHLFQRYNERLGLGLTNTIEIIKAFFSNSGYFQYLIYRNKDAVRNVGICKDGFCFGEIQKESGWLVNKTFISRDLAYDSQNSLEAELREKIKQDVLDQFAASNYNELAHQRKTDVMLSIAGHRHANHAFTFGR